MKYEVSDLQLEWRKGNGDMPSELKTVVDAARNEIERRKCRKSMTIREIVAQLEKYPSDAQVVVRGYEDGVELADKVQPCYIMPFNESLPTLCASGGEIPYWYGSHNKVDEADSGTLAVEIMTDLKLAEDRKGRNNVDEETTVPFPYFAVDTTGYAFDREEANADTSFWDTPDDDVWDEV